MPSDVIAHLLHKVPIDDVMSYLARVTKYDRYQASQGIELAASFVADMACAIGLTDVSVEHFPADGKAQWWSFRSPLSWTPTVARLELCAGNRTLVEVDHAQQPFTLATYSAPTPKGGVTARLINVPGSLQDLDLVGAIAVVGKAEFARNELLSELTNGGAIGFVTDAACCQAGSELEYQGRIELDWSTSLFGFSLTSRQLELFRTCAREGVEAHVVVDVDRSASMPVVTGVLPGECPDEEVWLVAHLCHPRPGANDNASGVAALLGVAASHVAARQLDASWGRRRTIRFIWGPEFLGTAAILHRQMGLPVGPRLPSAVIDMDMVGENQELCGCPFIVERSPDFYPTLISPIAEYVVSEVFLRTKAHHGTWRAAPFQGFSDHALFADPNVGCPAVLLCHSPDRFNHSAGDTLNKVSKVEMHRATAAGSALTQFMANDGALPRSVMERILQDWGVEEHMIAQRAAQQYGDVDGGNWGRQLIGYTDRRNAAMLSTLNSSAEDVANMPVDAPGHLPDYPTLLGQWSGPVNIRALIADLPEETMFRISDLIKADKNNYSLLLNFAIRAQGLRSQHEIIKETSFACRRPIDKGIAKILFQALIESKWVKEVSREDAHSPHR